MFFVQQIDTLLPTSFVAFTHDIAIESLVDFALPWSDRVQAKPLHIPREHPWSAAMSSWKTMMTVSMQPHECPSPGPTRWMSLSS